MKPLTRHIIFGLLMLANAISGQRALDTLWLKSGPVPMTEGRFERNSDGLSWVQFYTLPDENTQARLSEKGVLLRYVGQNTFFAYVGENSFFEGAAGLVRSARAVSAKELVDPGLHVFMESSEVVEVVARCYAPKPGVLQQVAWYRGVEHFELFDDGFSASFRVQGTSMAKLALAHGMYIEAAPKPQPEDLRGIAQHRSHLLVDLAGLPFSGAGVHVAVGDDGPTGNHIDLRGRMSYVENFEGMSPIEHVTQISGIMAGAGNLDPQFQGVAPGAFLHIVETFDAVKDAAKLYTDDSVRITCTSFADGCNRGYTTLAEQVDQQTLTHPGLLHVFSAGNAGEQDCSYGAGIGWGNITGGVKTAKNCITVGNVSSDDVIASSSSRGPTAEGRIKPDVVANGNGQITTLPNNAYGEASGSSAAAPVVAGIAAQMFEAYRSFYNQEAPTELIKASLLNSAEDLGTPGPDYLYGWGRVHAQRAWNIIEEQRFLNGVATNTENVNSYSIQVPENVKQLKVMLYWHDAPASPMATQSLVNDLELRVMNVGGTVFMPYVLSIAPSPLLLAAPATTGPEHLNNVEQITIENPAAGSYAVFVSTFSMASQEQPFVIVYDYVLDTISLVSPVAGDKIITGEAILVEWDASESSESFALSYSDNDGQTWNMISPEIPAAKRQFLWETPIVSGHRVMLRLQRGNQTSQLAAPFYVAQRPSNIYSSRICPDNIRIHWSPVPQATRYIVYKLGTYAMDSILVVSDTLANIPISNPEDTYWFGVQAASTAEWYSIRSVAIEVGGGLESCKPEHDVSISQLSSPQVTTLHQCFNQPQNVNVVVKNTGLLSSSAFDVHYRLNDGETVTQSYQSLIPPNVAVSISFDTPLIITDAGSYTLKVWTSMPNDEASYNDTICVPIQMAEAMVFQAPYIERFEDEVPQVPACGSAANIANGWLNETNNRDSMDWFVSNAVLAANIGPALDQNQNDPVGQYLLLSPAHGCTQREAVIFTPCIDLSNTATPEMSCWVNMLGTGTGRLRIDVFDGNMWYPNVVAPIVMETETGWQYINVDMSAFAGQTVVFRFRGFSGNNTQASISIDNFAVVDKVAPPIASFKLYKKESCTNAPVKLADNSYNLPVAERLWSFEPDNIVFTDGTDQNSEFPAVIFTQEGTYSITLIVSNAYGSDTLTLPNAIQISNGMSLPFVEDFETTADGNIPAKWVINNPDESIGWQPIATSSPFQGVSQTIFMDNHSYNAQNQQDFLLSPRIDLSTATQPVLQFDVAYAVYSTTFLDHLRIELAEYCDNNFNHVIYEKDGASLSTVSEQRNAWSPEGWYDWRTETIDLSAFVGSVISLRFINTCGFGNNLYLDNIRLFEAGSIPEISVSQSADTTCTGSSVTLKGTANQNTPLVWWDFGPDATPTSASTLGPHSVTFAEPGLKHVRAVVITDLGHMLWRGKINVFDEPQASFEQLADNNTITFINTSGNIESCLWDFGDGTTSTETNPTHVFQRNGYFDVSLTVTNACGVSYAYAPVLISTETTNPNTDDIRVFPNPGHQHIFVRTDVALRTDDIQFIDNQGRILAAAIAQPHPNLLRLDTEALPAGLYTLRLSLPDGTFHYLRAVIVH